MAVPKNCGEKRGKKEILRFSEINVHRCVHQRPCERRLKQEVPDGRLIIEHKDMHKGKGLPFVSLRLDLVGT